MCVFVCGDKERYSNLMQMSVVRGSGRTPCIKQQLKHDLEKEAKGALHVFINVYRDYKEREKCKDSHSSLSNWVLFFASYAAFQTTQNSKIPDLLLEKKNATQPGFLQLCLWTRGKFIKRDFMKKQLS